MSGEKKPHSQAFRHFRRKSEKKFYTRLLVSGRSPECSDCLLRFMEHNNIKNKCNLKKYKKKFLETCYENHPPTRHIKNKKMDFAPCKKSIIANKLLSTNLEPFLRTPFTR